MPEHDWRALLDAVIKDGNPYGDGGVDHSIECVYCSYGLSENPKHHAPDCAWRKAEEALKDA